MCAHIRKKNVDTVRKIKNLFSELEKSGLSQKQILKEIKQQRALRQLSKLFDQLKNEGWQLKDILERVKLEQVVVPLSVFSKKLSALETIVKYLRENRELKYNEIAKILARDPISIGVTYRNAVTKYKDRLDDSSIESFPAAIIQNRTLSVLENIVYYLKSTGLRFCEISDILQRDERTVWTVYNRALKKRGDSK